MPPSATALALTLLSFIALGCASPRLRRPLFVLEAANAAVPVMISRTRSEGAGRTLRAASSSREDVSENSETIGSSSGVNVTLHSTSVEEQWSAGPPWPQLGAQLTPADRWLQITRIQYRAVDERTLVTTSTERALTVEVVAQ